MIAQLFHLTSAERKTLLVAGAAAGMSGTFAAPISAVLLAVELLLFEWKPRSLVPVALACATALLVRAFLPLDAVPLFLIHEFYPDNMGFNPKGMVRMPYEMDKDGYITLPPGPGLGVEIDEKALAEAAKKPQTYKWPGAKLKDGSIADY